MKKLKRTGAAFFITDTGETVPENGELIIDAAKYSLYSRSNDVIAAIASGDLVYNDGSNDLSLADATMHLQGAFPKEIDLTTKTPAGLNKVAITKPDGNSKTYISHNFCDSSTWSSPTDSSWALDSVALGLGDLKVFKAEVQFTHDVIDAFNNDNAKKFLLDIMAGGARVDSDSKIFTTIFDIYDLGNKHYHTPAGSQTTLGGGINTVQFDYTDTIVLISAYAMQMKFFTENDLELPGTHCSVSLVAGPAT